MKPTKTDSLILYRNQNWSQLGQEIITMKVNCIVDRADKNTNNIGIRIGRIQDMNE